MYIQTKINFGGIWHLGGSRWVQNTHTGCGNNLPTSRNIFDKCVFSEIFPGCNCYLAWKRFPYKRSYLYMYRQIPTTKKTVWYVRRDYVFRVNSHCVGETLPTKSQRWIFHFPSYLVIELFHRRCFNDYFFLVFHFFVYFCLTPGGTLGTLGLNLSGI